MFFQIFVSIFCVAVFAKVAKALFGHLRLRHELRNIPGVDGLPILGAPLKADPVEYFQQLTSLCEDNYESGIAKIWLGPLPFFYVFRPKTVEEFYKSTKLVSKSPFYSFVKPWLGDGLLISGGKKWFDRRRLLTPAFHFKILEQFVTVFNDQFSTLVKILKEKVNESSGFDIQPYFYRCMLDIICEAAMGVKIDAQKQSENELIRTIYRETEVILHRMKSPWLWPDLIFRFTSLGREDKRNLNILHGFTRKVIMDRKAELRNKKATEANDLHGTSKGKETTGNFEEDTYLTKNKPRSAFLDLLLEAAEEDESLTDEGIQEEVDTFMFEGHDTTASGAVWLTYMLAFHADEQIKVQEEMDSIFGDSDREVTNEDIPKLQYTDCFIKETFRLYSPAPWYSRTASEACVIGGYSIPKGCGLGVVNNVLHRDPEYFPDPEKFDPTRWLNDNAASRHPYCYTPFSAGSRNCIGQRFAVLEEKIFLCHLMRNFNVTTKTKVEDIAITLTFVSKPSQPAMIQLTKRK